MELLLILILALVFVAYYLRQERINRLLFTFFLRDGRKSFDDVINNTYINDAAKIKKYVKKNFNNMIDVEKDEVFKDIKSVK